MDNDSRADIASRNDTETTIGLGPAFRQGWRLYLKDFGVLTLAGLIAAALITVTVGILGGPMIAGLCRMVLVRVREQRRPEVSLVFSGFERTGPLIVAGLVLAIVVGIAWITIIGGLLLSAIWLYVIPLMIDRGRPFGKALGESKDLVMANGLWPHVGLVLLLALINVMLTQTGGFIVGLGSGFRYGPIPVGLLAIFTTPFTVAVVIAMYEIVGGHRDQVEAA